MRRFKYSQNLDTCFALSSGRHGGDDGQRRVPLTSKVGHGRQAKEKGPWFLKLHEDSGRWMVEQNRGINVRIT